MDGMDDQPRPNSRSTPDPHARIATELLTRLRPKVTRSRLHEPGTGLAMTSGASRSKPI